MQGITFEECCEEEEREGNAGNEGIDDDEHGEYEYDVGDYSVT